MVFSFAHKGNVEMCSGKHVQCFRILAAGAFCLFLHAQQAVAAIGHEMIALQKSKPLVTRAGAWQTWNDAIHLKPSQDKMYLLLKFINGADGRAKFTDLRVQLAQKPFLTLQDFHGHATLTRDLTGTLKQGNTPITVQGFGPSGARLVWKLSTRRPTISSVTPNPFTLVQRVIISGKNFPDHVHGVQVLFAGKPAHVLSSSASQIQVNPPKELSGGKHDIVVSVHSVKSNAFHAMVKGNPRLKMLDFSSTAPGQPLYIEGSGFSKIASQNKVLFGSLRAEIISASETMIKCIVPEMQFPQWHVPVTVTTNGMPSNSLEIHIDVRVIENEEWFHRHHH